MGVCPKAASLYEVMLGNRREAGEIFERTKQPRFDASPVPQFAVEWNLEVSVVGDLAQTVGLPGSQLRTRKGLDGIVSRAARSIVTHRRSNTLPARCPADTPVADARGTVRR